MSKAILITQCLQNDFVAPIAPGDDLPNRLHVGADESRRLMGENPAEGPVAKVMAWAHSRPGDHLAIVHIRDWHDPADPADKAHLGHFGNHCLAGTPGAAFAFAQPSGQEGRASVIDALSLNDFQGTALDRILAPLAEKPRPVGIMGVWTEAKVLFLAYELATRYPLLQIGVCSALTASSSRARHFMALDQIERILGVRIFNSVGEFLGFLGGEEPALVQARFDEKHPEVRMDGRAVLEGDDHTLLRYLFRDCRALRCRTLDGGFSGNVVLMADSVDLHGHEQVPHVVKIGPRDPIGRERTAFERIEPVLGNNAPRIAEFADIGGRGALKYRYASMGGQSSATFQKLYMSGLPLERVFEILDTVFDQQLGRLYRAAVLESRDLLEYYQFSPRWAASVRQRVDAIAGDERAGDLISFPGGRSVRHAALFYEQDLEALSGLRRDSTYFAYVHGDLNGANIIIDQRDNVWLIDFFHTHHGHVLRDLIKLENDLLYIFTPLPDEAAFEEALRLSDLLFGVNDLARPPAEASFQSPHLARAYATLRHLRSFYPALINNASDPLHLFIGQLRYAVHTLSFDEPGPAQKRWALYTACRAAERVHDLAWHHRPLRVDWLDEKYTAPGRIGLTLLPGRRDYNRDPGRDLARAVQFGVTHTVSLITSEELGRYGVPDLIEQYRAHGLTPLFVSVEDTHAPRVDEMDRIVSFMDRAVGLGGRVMIHCLGGLGRSGTAAACFLKSRGLSARMAVEEVRRARSPRAVETDEQMDFVRNYQPPSEVWPA